MAEEKSPYAGRTVRIRRVRLVDESSRLVREMILAGKLPAGTRLRQADLAERFGISRTPLREALMKLEQEGLITVLAHGGFRVVELRLEDAIELYDIRELLDGLAARLTAESAESQTLKSLQGHLKKMEQCLQKQDAHRWFIHHVAFHEGVLRASGNSRLASLISNIRLSIQRFHPLLLTTENRLNNAFREHLAVFRAIQAKDSGQAERLARLHIANAKEIVRNLLSEQQPVGQGQRKQ